LAVAAAATPDASASPTIVLNGCLMIPRVLLVVIDVSQKTL
jgi:hypothetical protein